MVRGAHGRVPSSGDGLVRQSPRGLSRARTWWLVAALFGVLVGCIEVPEPLDREQFEALHRPDTATSDAAGPDTTSACQCTSPEDGCLANWCTPDGRCVETAPLDPTAIARRSVPGLRAFALGSDGTLWAARAASSDAASDGGELVAFAPGQAQSTVRASDPGAGLDSAGFDRAVAMSVSPVDLSVWLLRDDGAVIHVVAGETTTVETVATVSLTDPIAIVSTTAQLWLVERGGGVHVLTDGVLTAVPTGPLADLGEVAGASRSRDGHLLLLFAQGAVGIVRSATSAERLWPGPEDERARVEAPTGLAQGLDGTVVVPDPGLGRLQAYSAEGELLGSAALDAVLTAGASPRGVALGPDGVLYVGDDDGVSRTALDRLGCDDANGCTTDDICTGGTCDGPRECPANAAGCIGKCDDPDGDGRGQCIYVGGDILCDDGDACFGPDFCNQGKLCLPGVEVECDDQDSCTVESCDPQVGCLNEPMVTCDDGVACTVDDVCTFPAGATDTDVLGDYSEGCRPEDGATAGWVTGEQTLTFTVAQGLGVLTQGTFLIAPIAKEPMSVTVMSPDPDDVEGQTITLPATPEWECPASDTLAQTRFPLSSRLLVRARGQITLTFMPSSLDTPWGIRKAEVSLTGSTGGQCGGVPSAVLCDDGDPCTDDVCEGGCTSTPKGEGASCAPGICAPGTCNDLGACVAAPPEGPAFIDWGTINAVNATWDARPALAVESSGHVVVASTVVQNGERALRAASRGLDDGFGPTDLITDMVEADDLRAPALVPLGAGGFLVFWSAVPDPSMGLGDDRDIFVARSLDGGVTWSAPAPVADDAGTDTAADRSPWAAVADDGTVMVAWLREPIGGNGVIVETTSIDGGLSFDPVRSITTIGPDRRPRLATDNQGTWLALFLGSPQGGAEAVIAAVRPAGTTTWDKPGPVGGLGGATDLALIWAQSQWVAMWSEATPDQSIIDVAFSTDGSTWESGDATPFESTEAQDRPELARDGAGRVTTIFRQGDLWRLGLLDPQGNTWKLDDFTTGLDALALTGDGNGTYLVAERTDNVLGVRRWAAAMCDDDDPCTEDRCEAQSCQHVPTLAAATVLANELPVPAAGAGGATGVDAHAPALTRDAAGGVYALWVEPGVDSGNVFMRRALDSSATSWGDPVRLGDASDRSEAVGDLAADAAGQLVAVWETGDGAINYSVSVNGGLAWNEPKGPAAATTPSWAPVVASRDGARLVAWVCGDDETAASVVAAGMVLGQLQVPQVVSGPSIDASGAGRPLEAAIVGTTGLLTWGTGSDIAVATGNVGVGTSSAGWSTQLLTEAVSNIATAPAIASDGSRAVVVFRQTTDSGVELRAQLTVNGISFTPIPLFGATALTEGQPTLATADGLWSLGYATDGGPRVAASWDPTQGFADPAVVAQLPLAGALVPVTPLGGSSVLGVWTVETSGEADPAPRALEAATVTFPAGCF